MTEPLFLDDDDMFAVLWAASAEARAALAVSRAALRAVAALSPELRQAADAALAEEAARSAWLDPRAARRVRELLDDIRAELRPATADAKGN
jgi:hypothetical protein